MYILYVCMCRSLHSVSVLSEDFRAVTLGKEDVRLPGGLGVRAPVLLQGLGFNL